MRVVKYILLFIYIFIVILFTFLMFNLNKFGDSSFGSTTIIGLDNSLSNYKAGTLLVATSNFKTVKKGDKIFYYDTTNNKNTVNLTKVEDIMKTNNQEYTFVIEDNLFLSSEYLISTTSNVKSIPFLGYIYNIFISKAGYLILIVLPILLAFLYQLKNYRSHKVKL